MYEKRIQDAKSIAEIFSIVQDIVKKYLKEDQAGLLVGISDLGIGGQGFIGAYYSLSGNMIILNKKPLMRILQTNPYLYNYYVFHVLLHEYLHAIGSLNEAQTRQLTYEISNHFFGQNHVLTQLASNMEKFLPNVTYPGITFQPPETLDIEFVLGIDRKNLNYIV